MASLMEPNRLRVTAHRPKVAGSLISSSNEPISTGLSETFPFIDDSPLLTFFTDAPHNLPLSPISTNILSLLKRNSHPQANERYQFEVHKGFRRRTSPGEQYEPHPLDSGSKYHNRSSLASSEHDESTISKAYEDSLPLAPEKRILHRQLASDPIVPRFSEEGEECLLAIKSATLRRRKTQSEKADGINYSKTRLQQLNLAALESEGSTIHQPFPASRKWSLDTETDPSRASLSELEDFTIERTVTPNPAISSARVPCSPLITPAREPESPNLGNASNGIIICPREAFATPTPSRSRGNSNAASNTLNSITSQTFSDKSTSTVTPRKDHHRLPSLPVSGSADAVILSNNTMLSTSFSHIPSDDFRIPTLTLIHILCYQSHRYVKPSPNIYVPVPCMVCYIDDQEMRWKCPWCCLRICGGCMEGLDRIEGRDLSTLIKYRNQGSESRSGVQSEDWDEEAENEVV